MGRGQNTNFRVFFNVFATGSAAAAADFESSFPLFEFLAKN